MGVQKCHFVLIIGKFKKCISQALTYCFLYFYPPMFGSVYGSASTNRHGPQLVCQCAIWTNLYLSVSHFFTSCSQRTWQHSTLLYRATTLPCQPANCPRYTHTFPLNWLHQPLGNFTCFWIQSAVSYFENGDNFITHTHASASLDISPENFLVW